MRTSGTTPTAADRRGTEATPVCVREAVIDWCGVRLTLLDDRAVYLEAERALFVADIHLGKASAFGVMGIPVPAKTNDHDLDRLVGLVDRTGARTLIILGDLLHHRRGRCGDTLAAGERVFGGLAGRGEPVRTVLVRGNHDANAGDPPAAWRISCEDGPVSLGGLTLVHDPAEAPTGVRGVLCGHVHPTIGFGGRSRCFWFGEGIGVLPSFGTFTGGKSIAPGPGDTVYAVGPKPGDGIVRVPIV